MCGQVQSAEEKMAFSVLIGRWSDKSGVRQGAKCGHIM